MVNYIPEFQGYSGQGAFRYWCQKVLPLVYDDSLSYYELLNKVVVYLNNTIEDVSKAEGNIDSLLTAYTQLQNYVNDYFDNLDVQEEINHKLDEMAENGELSDLLEPFIPNLVTTWLNEHITPTTPPVDDTLSISGAAADAKVTGDEIAKAIKSLTYISHDDLKGYTTANDFPNNSVIGIGSNVLDTDIANLPLYGVLSYVITTSYDPTASSKCQLYLGVTYFAMRVKTSNTWGGWRVSANNVDVLKYALQNLDEFTSLAELPVNVFSVVNNSKEYTDFPSNTTAGVIINMKYSQNFMLQFFICFQQEKIRIWWRVIDKRDNSVYVEWQGLANLSEIENLTNTVSLKANTADVLHYEAIDWSLYNSIAELPINIMFLLASPTDTNYTDYPEGVTQGIFYSYRYSLNFKVQFIIQFSHSSVNDNRIYFRIVNISTYEIFSDWKKFVNYNEIEPNLIKYIAPLSTYISDNNFTKLSNIKENIITLYQDLNLPDEPRASTIFSNMRYSAGYDIQFSFPLYTKQFQYRITNRNTGEPLTKWAVPVNLNIKSILGMGDSICYGARNNGRGFIGGLYIPWKRIAYPGARLSNTRISEANHFCIYQQFIDFITDTENADYYPDVVIANGGINDYGNNVVLGSLPEKPVQNDTEAEALDKSTLGGGLQYLFYLWIKHYPKAQRFFVATHRDKNKPWTKNYSGGYTQTEMNEFITKVCEMYSVKVIDVFNESFLNTAFSEYISPIPYDKDHPELTADYYVNDDGVHPLDLGYVEGYLPLMRKALQIGTHKE